MQTVENQCELYLEKAAGAMSRRDYLSAIQFALRAADAPQGPAAVRCDAYMLLALSSMEMDLAEDALAFAVGAHLAACWAHDDERQQKAASVVSLVVSKYPAFGMEETLLHVH